MTFDTASETWRDIPGWEGFYQVSTNGRVRSLDRIVKARHPASGKIEPRKYAGRVLRLNKMKNGYLWVSLVCNQKLSREYVHRLVLRAFAGLCPDGLEVCHGNGIRDDNRLENLRYGTRSENAFDALRHGKKVVRGVAHGHSKFDAETIIEAKSLHGKMSSRKAASVFGVTHKTMLNLWAGKSYVE